jgi:hypothetical protein
MVNIIFIRYRYCCFEKNEKKKVGCSHVKTKKNAWEGGGESIDRQVK